MTREEAIKAAEVMMAYAEGKNIEYCRKGDHIWSSAITPAFDWYTTNYRIKQEREPTYRPFKDKEECWNEMQKHQPFGWVKNIGSMEYMNIKIIGVEYVDAVSYFKIFESFTFADGTPFGIKEE